MRRSILLSACLLLCRPSFAAPPVRAAKVSSQTKQALLAPSRIVASALARNDTRTLARYVHPQTGVRFSPYVYLDVKRSRAWKPAELRRLAGRKTRFNWGDRDGEGGPILLNWNAFRREYLSPFDFSRRGTLTVGSVTSRGNTINNLPGLYPNTVITEFHTSGTEKYGGMDWRSLWLVWRQSGGKWHLVAVAGDQWST